jgi:hypothetical protein
MANPLATTATSRKSITDHTILHFRAGGKGPAKRAVSSQGGNEGDHEHRQGECRESEYLDERSLRARSAWHESPDNHQVDRLELAFAEQDLHSIFDGYKQSGRRRSRMKTSTGCCPS